VPRHSETDIFLRKSSTRYLGTMYAFLYLEIHEKAVHIVRK